ncbi:hypothetical protein CYLTODRAFT_442639 [Cylindrobasidium torrendii FP15055 ss-10]|uniref:Uncharacterized protein n=1 Tax=Cylindrobasidium torrendii FP15055 ss-10 TaxID=1314674 RepID=A0A0D7BIK9_9AGAR|nr:hypothetical protein CYLTODRAFT_442639 [Cylindrobasidium torrendii FP15055 ss-10]
MSSAVESRGNSRPTRNAASASASVHRRSASHEHSSLSPVPEPVGWEHPDELPLLDASSKTKDEIVEELLAGRVSIPGRPSSRMVDLVAITSIDGTKTMIPSGYRIPLLFVIEFLWWSMRLVLGAQKDIREEEWRNFRSGIWYVGRLLSFFLEAAREKAKSPESMDKRWRCPTFDRVLCRYRMGWMLSSREHLEEFHSIHGEEPYKRDMLTFHWKTVATKGQSSLKVPMAHMDEGVDAIEFSKGIVKVDGDWIYEDPANVALPANPEAPAPFEAEPPPPPDEPAPAIPSVAKGKGKEKVDSPVHLETSDENVLIASPVKRRKKRETSPKPRKRRKLATPTDSLSDLSDDNVGSILTAQTSLSTFPDVAASDDGVAVPESPASLEYPTDIDSPPPSTRSSPPSDIILPSVSLSALAKKPRAKRQKAPQPLNALLDSDIPDRPASTSTPKALAEVVVTQAKPAKPPKAVQKVARTPSEAESSSRGEDAPPSDTADTSISTPAEDAAIPYKRARKKGTVKQKAVSPSAAGPSVKRAARDATTSAASQSASSRRPSPEPALPPAPQADPRSQWYPPHNPYAHFMFPQYSWPPPPPLTGHPPVMAPKPVHPVPTPHVQITPTPPPAPSPTPPPPTPQMDEATLIETLLELVAHADDMRSQEARLRLVEEETKELKRKVGAWET